MLQFLGRVLLVSAILFWSYSLFSHSETINKFNSNLPGVLKLVTAIPADVVKVITENILYVRYAVVGLLGLSALLILVRSKCVTILVLLGNATTYVGFAIHTAVLANPSYDRSEATWQNFIQHVGVAGALIYLIGTSCCNKTQPKAKLSAAATKKGQ
jgi:hypothetical protein